MTRLERRVTSFLGYHLHHHQVRSFVLGALSSGPGKKVVYTYDVHRRLEDGGEVERLAKEVVREAVGDAEVRGPVPQQYRLAVYHLRERKPARKIEFVIRPKRPERITIRIPIQLKDALERAADAQHRSIADVIISALEQQLGRSSRKGE